MCSRLFLPWMNRFRTALSAQSLQRKLLRFQRTPFRMKTARVSLFSNLKWEWANSQCRHQAFNQIVKIPSLNTTLDPPVKTTGFVSTDFNILNLHVQTAQFLIQRFMDVSIPNMVAVLGTILPVIYMISWFSLSICSIEHVLFAEPKETMNLFWKMN